MVTREVQLRFDYEALDSETRAFVLERVERIHNLARMTAAGIVQIGQYVTEVKDRLKHGQFQDWIEREFSWSQQAARDFMHVHQCFKTTNFVDLAIDVSALYLIARPSTPEPVRKEVIRRAENGELVAHSGTRALVQHFAETGEIPDIQVNLGQMIAERRRLLSPPSQITKATPEERAAAQRKLEQMKANTLRMAGLMSVVEAIECIVKTPFSISEIARHIERFDTPDQDWRGKAQESYSKLGQLCKELQL